MGQDAAKRWFLSVIFLVSSLVLKYHFFCTLSMVMTLVSLINTKTKEYFVAAIYTFGLHEALKKLGGSHTSNLLCYHANYILIFQTKAWQ